MLRWNLRFIRQWLPRLVRLDPQGKGMHPQMFFEMTGEGCCIHFGKSSLGVYSHFRLSTIFFSFSERSVSFTKTTSPFSRVTSRVVSEIRSRKASEGEAPVFSNA